MSFPGDGRSQTEVFPADVWFSQTKHLPEQEPTAVSPYTPHKKMKTDLNRQTDLASHVTGDVTAFPTAEWRLPLVIRPPGRNFKQNFTSEAANALKCI